jgi:hypothetical protein
VSHKENSFLNDSFKRSYLKISMPTPMFLIIITMTVSRDLVLNNDHSSPWFRKLRGLFGLL